MERSDVTISSGADTLAAWLYRPDGDAQHVPVVVMAHGFSAVREQKLDETAARFAAAGLGALLFDYRGFGASGGTPRQVLDIGAQHDDWRAAIRYARGLEWADPERIALLGSSFSGGHVMVLAAEDPHIAAAVAQCPFTDGLATLPKLGWANVLKLGGAGIYDQARALAGLSPFYVPSVAAPGAFAVMATEDAESGFAAIDPPESTWENRVAARIALHVGTYRPGTAAARVRCPLLVHICDTDTLAPAGATARHVAKAPRAEVRHYPIGHFDIYVGEAYEKAVADQTAFLTRTLGVGAARDGAESLTHI